MCCMVPTRTARRRWLVAYPPVRTGARRRRLASVAPAATASGALCFLGGAGMLLTAGPLLALSSGLGFCLGTGGVGHQPRVITVLMLVWLAMVVSAVVR